MVKLLAFLGSAFGFTLIGVLVAYIAVENLPISPRSGNVGKDDNLVIVLSVLPTLVGSLLGFVVGCVAAWLAGRGSRS